MAATIRRLYLYLVAFISLDLVIASVLNLIRILLDQWKPGGGLYLAGQAWRLEASLYIALLLVSGAVYAVHWLLCWRFARTRDDRGTTIRSVYLYSVLAVAMSMILYHGYDLVNRVLSTGLDRLLTNYHLYREQAACLSLLANLVVAGLLWGAHVFVLRRDGRALAESSQAATVRRLYAYSLGAAGLTVLILGLIDLAREGMYFTLTISGLLRTVTAWDTLSESVARAVVGGVVWLGHALGCQVCTSQDERHSVVRPVYLYAVLVATASTVFTALIFILDGALDLVLGSGGMGSIGVILADFSRPASMDLVCGAFWLLHRVLLARDERLAGEAPVHAHLRRLYGYLMAGIGLGLVVAGGANLFHTLLRLAASALAPGTLVVYAKRVLPEELSLYIALLLVGLPVWLFYWIRLQRAWRPDDPAGLWRRIYLYLIFLSSALAFLFNATWTLHILLNVALGLKDLSYLGWELCNPLSNLVFYGMMWAYHLFVLRWDVRAARLYQAAHPAAPLAATIAVVDDGDGALGAIILGRLQEEGTGATLVPVGLSLAAVETMAAALGEAPRSTGEMIAGVQRAGVLVGPVRAFLARPADETPTPFNSLAAALAASPARRILLPSDDGQHALVGLAHRSPEALARQAVRWTIQAARGEEPRGGEGLSVGAVVGLTILATLLVMYVVPVVILALVWVVIPADL